jgi:hypothetical protein
VSTWTRLGVDDLRSTEARSAAYLAQHRGLAVEVWRTAEGAEVVVGGTVVTIVQRNGMRAEGPLRVGETLLEATVRLTKAQPRVKAKRKVG